MSKLKPIPNTKCISCKGIKVVYNWRGALMCAPCLESERVDTNVKIYKNTPKGWPKAPRTSTIVRVLDKIGQNQKCPCGSGIKYKKCCNK